jgi:two-component system sensor histidine kinase ComP
MDLHDQKHGKLKRGNFLKEIFSKILIVISWLVTIIYLVLTLLFKPFVFLNFLNLAIGVYSLFLGTFIYFKAKNYPPAFNFLLFSISICFCFMYSYDLDSKQVGLTFLVLCPVLLYFFLYSFIQAKNNLFFKITLVLLISTSAISMYASFTKKLADISLVVLMIATIFACLFILLKEKNYFFQSSDFCMLNLSILLSYFPLTLIYFLFSFSYLKNGSHTFSFLVCISLLSVLVFPSTIAYILIKNKIIILKHDYQPLLINLLCTVLFAITLYLVRINENKRFVISSLFFIISTINSLLNIHLNDKRVQKINKLFKNFSNEKVELLNQLTYSKLVNGLAQLILKSLTHTIEIDSILVIYQSDNKYMTICEKNSHLSKSMKKQIKNMKIQTQQLKSKKYVYLCIPIKHSTEIIWVFLGQRKNYVDFSKLDTNLVVETIEQYGLLLTMTTQLHESQQKYISAPFITDDVIQKKIFSRIESEKMNYANYLHDHILQTIIGLNTLVGNLNGDKEILKVINIEFSKLIQSIRTQTFDIFPSTLYNLTFEENLKILMTDLNKKKPEEMENLCLNMSIKQELPKHIIAPAYRMIKELNENVLKHSLATTATTNVFIHNHQLHIIVEDNGIGINEYLETSQKDTYHPKQHTGILSIKNDLNWLNGSFKYVRKTIPKNRTKIMLKIPLEREATYEYITN